MKNAIVNPVSIGLAGAAVGLAAFGQWPLAALAAILAIASVAVGSMKATRSLRNETQFEDLSNEDRSRLSPLRRLRNDIHDLVELRKGDVTIAVIGAEAVAEADHILAQAAKMLRIRKDLVKASSGKGEAAREVQSLEEELNQARSDTERATLAAAIEARKLELAHYGEAGAALDRIVAGLRQAEAALSEMKARLTTAVSAGLTEEGADDDLRETIGRLKSLGTSLDEAENWLKG